jgi:hypothetical protein
MGCRKGAPNRCKPRGDLVAIDAHTLSQRLCTFTLTARQVLQLVRIHIDLYRFCETNPAKLVICFQATGALHRLTRLLSS